jgi:hypothetical protein
MSCAGKGYGTNPQSNAYLLAQFYSYSLINTSTIASSRKCRKTKPILYPSFEPNLFNLSTTTSSAGSYSLVYISGSNLLPNGTTFVKFGSEYLPIIYYSSFYLSFVVPLNAGVGNYQVQLANLYNGNFCPQINQSYPGNINLSSNSITYTIT